MDINNKIKDYLAEKQISQTELANKIGLSSTSLNRSLNSEDLKVSLLVKICQALKIPVSTFFDGSEMYTNTEIEEYKAKIEEYGILYNRAIKQIEESNEQSKKLIHLVSVLFSTESSEEAEKARLVLKSLVDFFRVDAPNIYSQKNTKPSK